jgi:sporulation integral membrane protein YtvI
MPFVIGFLIAVAVRPAIRFFHKKTGVNIQICGVATVLVLITALILLAFFGLSRLFVGIAEACAQLPAFAQQLSEGLSALSVRLSDMLEKTPSFAGIKIDTSLGGISAQILKITALAENTGNIVQSVVKSIPGFFINVIVTIVASCFISADYPNVTGFIIRQLPKRYQKTAIELKSFFMITVARVIRAYLTLMVITFAELSAGLMLLRIPHAIIVAAVIAVVDVLPVLGTGTVMIPWTVIELIMGDFYKALGLILVYAIIAVVRNILEPKIVGQHIGLHPLVTLAAIIIGLKAMGFAGMIFFPICIIILKHLRESGIISLWKD